MTGNQRLLVVAVFVVAVIGGGVLAFALLGGGSGSSPSSQATTSLAPTAVAQATGSPTPAPSSPAPATASPSPTAPPAATASPTPAPTPTPAATPRPTAAPGQPATVTFVSLMLDAQDDPDGRNRRVDVRTRGTGRIAASVRVTSPQGMAVLCLRVDGVRIGCTTTADGTVEATTRKRAVDVVVTVRGSGIEAPVVDLALDFPASAPTVRLRNARFDGTAFPDTNGIQALLGVRRDGEVALDAEWGGKPFKYEVDLLEQGGGPGAHVLADQGPATGVDTALPVTGGATWKLLLQNIDTGFGVTPLDATIAWP